MPTYYRFKYSAGCVGTDSEKVVEVPDNYSEEDVEKLFDDWYESMNRSSGYLKEISESEAQDCGVDESYCD